MNKKILGLLAASAAVVGSAIFSAPARAVQQDVNVNLTVDEVLFLRTFETVDLRVSQGELSGGAVDKDFNQDPTTDGTALIDIENAPNLRDITGGDSVTKTVRELYAVWGNGNSNVTVTVRPSPGGEMLSNGETGRAEVKARMSVLNDQLLSDRDFGDLRDDETPLVVGGVELQFDFTDDRDSPTNPQAGAYTGGRLTVEATTIGS